MIAAEPNVGESPDIFSFQRENHVYRLGARVVPSVTQVLRRAGLIRWHCSQEQLKRAAKRGSEVHMIVCDIEREGPDYWSDGEFSGYARAWHAFKEMSGYVSAQAEGRIYNKAHDYAGSFDNTGWLNYGTPRQRAALVELKTGTYEPWHREQTAGYGLCLSNNRLSAARLARLGVYLRSDGKFHVEHFDDPRDGLNFLAALAVSRMRSERKLCNDDEVFDQIVNGLDPYAGLETMLRAWSVPS